MMTEGEYLNHSGFSLTNKNKSRVGYNTFKLLDSCAACETEYNATGSYISIPWDQLLNNGEGPEAGSTQEAAFEEAKRAIYFIYEQKIYTQLYKNYLDAQAAYLNIEMKAYLILRSTMRMWSSRRMSQK